MIRSICEGNYRDVDEARWFAVAERSLASITRIYEDERTEYALVVELGGRVMCAMNWAWGDPQ